MGILVQGLPATMGSCMPQWAGPLQPGRGLRAGEGALQALEEPQGD